jgi:diaminopimelate epimerase
VKDADETDLITKAREIRYSPPFADNGINVNFVEMRDGEIYVRTYERGVEDETLSCGTGVTASALASAAESMHNGHCNVLTRGGKLTLSIKKIDNGFTDIWLKGPVEFVFKGEIDL